MRWRWVAIFLGLAARPVCGEPPAQPAPAPAPAAAEDPVAAAALAVEEAVRGKAAPRLAELAASDDPDPWLVADRLCERASFDAAVAFAAAATARPDVERLAGYVAQQRAGPSTAAHRAGLAVVATARSEERWEDGLRALEKVGVPSDDVTGVRLDAEHARLLLGAVKVSEALAAEEVACTRAERIGWIRAAGETLREVGGSARGRADDRALLGLWQRDLALEERRGDQASIAWALGCLGDACGKTRDLRRMAACYARAVEICEARKDDWMGAACLQSLMLAYQGLEEQGNAVDVGIRALAACERLADPSRIARARTMLGSLRLERGEIASAIETLGPVPTLLAPSTRPADLSLLAHALTVLGCARAAAGEIKTGREQVERAVELYRSSDQPASQAWARLAWGSALGGAGDPAGAALEIRSSVEAFAEAKDVVGMASALVALCALQRAGRDYARALATIREARALVEPTKDPKGLATLLAEEGEVLRLLGDYVLALDLEDQALATATALCSRSLTARVQLVRGNLFFSLGDGARAVTAYEGSQRLYEEIGSPSGSASALSNLGAAFDLLHDYARSKDTQLQVRKILGSLGGDRSLVVRSLINLADVEIRLKDPAKALAYLDEAAQAVAPLQDRRLAEEVRLTRAEAHLALHEDKAALEHFQRVADEAESLRADDLRVRALVGAARAHVALGEAPLGVWSARAAIPILDNLGRGPSDAASATAREQYADLFDVGVLAAAAADDQAGVVRFLEGGRGVALLESLGGREALQAATLPPKTLASLVEARAAAAAAQMAYARSYEDGVLADARRRLTELDAARARQLELTEGIEHDARKSASILYPRAATLSVIQSWLRPEDALVLYALLEDPDVAFALVVRQQSARVIQLGPASVVARACTDLDPANRRRKPEEAEKARKTLVDLVTAPLSLPPDVRRVLVSPDGALSYVPFSMVLPDRDIAYVPSGTTYKFLRENEAPPGSGVLAIADPDYRAPRPHDDAAASLRGPSELSPLPGTRLEAQAVGADPILLGPQATESGLVRALRQRPRWHSVLFGCHGLVDPLHPALSSLALTADAQDDGFLTVLDVFRTSIPADLVFLSACETGRGRIVRGEGIVGLVRAFMYAGAPRVVASLWAVDDDATRVLVTAFYEAWKSGSSPAAALRKAQTVVRDSRDHDWRHPAYWAAWVLWGLPD